MLVMRANICGSNAGIDIYFSFLFRNFRVLGTISKTFYYSISQVTDFIII